jgi:hypothetical protein
MKKLSKQAIEEIRQWVYCNARPLELELWRYHFEHGNKEAVISVLMNYQNRDGGFGHAIDPDNWNPDSSPYNVSFAIDILRSIDFYDITHPIYEKLFHYLENTEHKADYGWFFTIPSNEYQPHACWWDYNANDNVFQSIGITAMLSGFILRYGKGCPKLYQMAMNYARQLIEKLQTTTEFGDIGVKGYIKLMDDIEGAGLTKEFNFQSFYEKLREVVNSKIDINNFMVNPLGFIWTPESKFYEDNKSVVHTELDQIIDQRPAAGVWGIPWEWYNDNKYPKAFAISENWWKSFKAIEIILLLKAFGRLEE